MVRKIRSIFQLLRIRQYYKNGMIFVGLFFSQNLFEISLYFTLFIGFFLLCFASSINYIINDLRDIEKDKVHPEKLKKKPLASGEISINIAILLLVILTCLIIISLIVIIPNLAFTFIIIFLIITGQLYNIFLKNYAFIDVIILSIGYLWRALAGCAIIEEYISAWLFLAIFEVALFLSISKRKGDLTLLGKDKAIEHKRVYDEYSIKLLDQFEVLIACSLFITYSLYLIFKFSLYIPGSASLYEFVVIFTIPLALYIIMRFMYLTSSKPEIARSTEKVFFDKGFIIAAIILLIFLFFSFYYNEIIAFLNF